MQLCSLATFQWVFIHYAGTAVVLPSHQLASNTVVRVFTAHRRALGRYIGGLIRWGAFWERDATSSPP